MKDLIKEILDANRKAEDDEDVKKLRVESSNRVTFILNERREEYIDKARMNIKVIKKIEDSKAAVEIDKIHSDCDKKLKQLNDAYLNCKDEWSKQIFDNVIKLQDMDKFQNSEEESLR